MVLAGLTPTACASLDQWSTVISEGSRPVSQLPGWQQETASGLRAAMQLQCTRTRSLEKQWLHLCEQLDSLTDKNASSYPAVSTGQASDRQIKQWVHANFEAWPVISQRGANEGLLTGYYEPIISGSLTKTSNDQAPLYAKPAGLTPADPRFTREQIETGQAAPLLGEPVMWIDDPVEAFFLQIQGSGRVLLPDGSIVRAAFAAHNGHKYHAIGRDLIRDKKIKRSEMSAQKIKDWLRTYKQDGVELMQRNPRYVFFNIIQQNKNQQLGPNGSMQVPLTKMRSVATDRRFLPSGSLLYLDSKLPEDWQDRVGLALAQDTGGAIKGEIRADLFTGTGQSAGALAGELKAPLRIWLLWPKGATPPDKLPVAKVVINP